MPVTGDQHDARVVWTDSSAEHNGKVVRLRVTLHNAKFYSYWFVNKNIERMVIGMFFIYPSQNTSTELECNGNSVGDVRFAHRRLAGFDGFDKASPTQPGATSVVSIRHFVPTQPGASTQVAGLTELQCDFSL